MAILIGLWHRCILWSCLHLFLLRGLARPDHGLGSTSQCRRDLCQGLCWGLVGHLCLRGPHLENGKEAHLSGKKSTSGSVSTSSIESRRKGGMGVSTPDVSEPSTSSSSSLSTSATFQVGMLFKFFDQWRSITSNRFVLNMVQVTIFSLDSILPCSMTFGTLMSGQLQLIILLFRRRLMSFLLREQ